MNTKWTGERLETFVYNLTTIEHIHRYAIAIEICRDRKVLDIACGEGYGSNLMSFVAENVIGVDISGETVEKAKSKYKRNNLEFIQGSTSLIPVPDNSVDIVVSFETIEHHDQHTQMLKEIKRVLKPDGILIMSSPDKKYYSDEVNYKNPFHVKELYSAEFKELVNLHFEFTKFYFQKVSQGSLIVPEVQPEGFVEYFGDYDKIEMRNVLTSKYNICLASAVSLPVLKTSFFEDNFLNNVSHEDIINQITRSWTFRAGKLVLLPIRSLKTVLTYFLNKR